MDSTAFPWLSKLTDEQAYQFIGEVIDAAQDAGTHTAFLRRVDILVTQHAPAPTLPHGVTP